SVEPTTDGRELRAEQQLAEEEGEESEGQDAVDGGDPITNTVRRGRGDAGAAPGMAPTSWRVGAWLLLGRSATLVGWWRSTGRTRGNDRPGPATSTHPPRSGSSQRRGRSGPRPVRASSWCSPSPSAGPRAGSPNTPTRAPCTRRRVRARRLRARRGSSRCAAARGRRRSPVTKPG